MLQAPHLTRLAQAHKVVHTCDENSLIAHWKFGEVITHVKREAGYSDAEIADGLKLSTSNISNHRLLFEYFEDGENAVLEAAEEYKSYAYLTLVEHMANRTRKGPRTHAPRATPHEIFILECQECGGHTYVCKDCGTEETRRAWGRT